MALDRTTATAVSCSHRQRLLLVDLLVKLQHSNNKRSLLQVYCLPVRRAASSNILSEHFFLPTRYSGRATIIPYSGINSIVLASYKVSSMLRPSAPHELNWSAFTGRFTFFCKSICYAFNSTLPAVTFTAHHVYNVILLLYKGRTTWRYEYSTWYILILT